MALFIALVFALIPGWLTGLEQRTRLRYALAAGIAILATVILYVDASQAHAQDVAYDQLKSEVDAKTSGIDQHLSEFEQHTATVPKALFHTSEAMGESFIPTGVLFGVDVTVTNDGDDATFSSAYATSLANGIPNEAGQRKMIAEVHKNLERTVAQPHGQDSIGILRHGESIVKSAYWPFPDIAAVNKLQAHQATAVFGTIWKFKTTTGLRRTIVDCTLYQGYMLVKC